MRYSSPEWLFSFMEGRTKYVEGIRAATSQNEVSDAFIRGYLMGIQHSAEAITKHFEAKNKETMDQIMLFAKSNMENK